MAERYEQILKDNKLSLTAVRLAVLQVLQDHPHSDAMYIFARVKKNIATASRQAIYNNLNTLVEHAIVREIKPKGKASLYETKVGDNHHHIVCTNCDQVSDTDCHSFAPCLSPTDSHGFAIKEAEVIFWGLCPDCQK
ncbi:MAG: transcriptional repressor [Rhodobiaceae bacterium]|jgi:Fe2+ or Zn2+ uptake regulation protein|nr:transcriptional repressor [Rhodobiaceae bacterium]